MKWLWQKLRLNASGQWAAAADRVARRRRPPPADLYEEARLLHADLTRFLQQADALRQNGAGQALPQAQAGTDWWWRPLSLSRACEASALVAPGSGQRFGYELTLWHDCPRHALILRQIRNQRHPKHPPYALRLEMLGFGGDYLSLSMDLPDEARADLGSRHVLRLDGILAAERALTAYARINLVQGPNTATILRQLGDPIDGPGAERFAEFDLAYADITNRAIDKAWLDLIFAAPAMNAVTIHDLALSRHPRAEI